MSEEDKRDEGMERAAARNAALLSIARAHARQLSADGRITDADEVRAKMIQAKECLEFGNWMGSVFKTAEWMSVGFCKATHFGSHARWIQRWKRLM